MINLEKIKTDPLFAILVAILAITVSVGLSLIFNFTGPWQAIGGVVFAGLVAVFSALIAHRITEHRLAALDVSIGRIEGIAPSTKFDWLLTDIDLMALEKDKSTQEMWIISPNLQNDIDGGPFQPIVKANIKKGSRYEYFLPKTDLIEGRISQVQELFIGYEENLNIHRLTEEQFGTLPLTHVGIFNPNPKANCHTRVFFEAPSSERGWWIEADKTLASQMIGRLKCLREDSVGSEKS